MSYPTSIKLPDDLLERIERIAASETRKRNAMIAILLREAVEARAAAKPKRRAAS